MNDLTRTLSRPAAALLVVLGAVSAVRTYSSLKPGVSSLLIAASITFILAMIWKGHVARLRADGYASAVLLQVLEILSDLILVVSIALCGLSLASDFLSHRSANPAVRLTFLTSAMFVLVVGAIQIARPSMDSDSGGDDAR